MDDGDHTDVLLINALMHCCSRSGHHGEIENTTRRPDLGKTMWQWAPSPGLIGMKAEGVSGSVALSLTLSAIRAISRSLLGYEITSIDKEAADLVGELTNMLVGGAKRILREKGYDFDMQIPQLLRGDGHEIIHHYPGQTVLLPFKLNQDEFYIELNFI
jgi:chemotaxis protein CheX